MNLNILLILLAASFKLGLGCISGGGGTGGGGQTGTNTGFSAILGGTAKAEPFSSGSTGDFVAAGSELNCIDAAACRWKNVEGDAFDWQKITGKPDPTRLDLTSGAKSSWDPDALGVISDKRAADERALLVSDPIGCAPLGGTFSYNYWKSKGLPGENEAPKVETCWRFMGGSELKDCATAPGPIGPDPGTVVYSFPPTDVPIELVVSASNFVTDAPVSPLIPGVPQGFRVRGGYVVIDDMAVQADAVPSDGCPIDPPTTQPTVSTRAPTDFPETPSPTPFPSTPGPGGISDQESCLVLSCAFNQDTCLFNQGFGASDVAWEGPMTAADNSQTGRSNPLTGIRSGPFNNVRKDSTDRFVKCKFEDPRSTVIDSQRKCVMASMDIPGFSDQANPFMCMQVYRATEGVMLIAEGDGQQLWQSGRLERGTKAAENRKWRQECFRIPVTTRQVQISSGYDSSRKYNAGEVGVAGLTVKSGGPSGPSLC